MEPFDVGPDQARRAKTRSMTRSAPPRVLITPHNEENPYLPLLGKALSEVGVVSDWLRMEWTPSQTLNGLLLPIELTLHRLRGFNVLHLHWSYRFGWYWSRRLPLVRSLPRRWFGFSLWFAGVIGFRIVYTSHEPLPLAPVFDDDVAGRSPLFRRSRVIITITEAAKEYLVEGFGVDPARVEVIPEGPPMVAHQTERAPARTRLGVSATTPLLAMFGHIDSYKGADLLLEAVLQLPPTTRLSIRLLGASGNPQYANKLEDLVRRLEGQGRDVRWKRGAFSDEDLDVLLAATDFVVIPFRLITNSSSMRVAMARRVPLLVPDLPELVDIPATALFRYDRTLEGGLREGLNSILHATPDDIAARVAAAYEWTTAWTWHAVGLATKAIYERALLQDLNGRR